MAALRGPWKQSSAPRFPIPLERCPLCLFRVVKYSEGSNIEKGVHGDGSLGRSSKGMNAFVGKDKNRKETRNTIESEKPRR